MKRFLFKNKVKKKARKVEQKKVKKKKKFSGKEKTFWIKNSHKKNYYIEATL